jgi:hypothetical protein
MNLRRDDLLGQNKAVEEFVEFLSVAGRKVDSRAAGLDQAMAQVARLTGFPIAAIQQRIKRSQKRTMPRRTGASAQVAASRQPNTQVPTARERAEAFVLGYLLREPSQWHAAQTAIDPRDFTPGPRRELAEIYWRHQRDEGEPVLSELLALLQDEPEVKLLAVELAQGMSEVSEPGKMLEAHLQYLQRERERLAQRELESRLRGGAAQDEAAILEMISASTRVPDPRRLVVPYGV